MSNSNLIHVRFYFYSYRRKTRVDCVINGTRAVPYYICNIIRVFGFRAFPNHNKTFVVSRRNSSAGTRLESDVLSVFGLRVKRNENNILCTIMLQGQFILIISENVNAYA